MNIFKKILDLKNKPGLSKEDQIFADVLSKQFGVSESGYALDEIPEGHGKFGLDVSNPIPVAGIIASEIYLRKLRTEDGQEVSWDRIASFNADNIDDIIDGYRIYNTSGDLITTLYICPYHKKISEKAPDGFILLD